MKGGLYLTLIKLHCSAASEKICGRLGIEWSNSWLSVCLGSGSKSVSKRSCQTNTMSPMIWKDIMHGKHNEHTISALSEESGRERQDRMTSCCVSSSAPHTYTGHLGKSQKKLQHTHIWKGRHISPKNWVMKSVTINWRYVSHSFML